MADREGRARRKRKALGQMMEGDSIALLRQALPRQWEIHGYAPDFGIDGTVEVFEMLEGKPDRAETLGEIFLFQLKAVTTREPKQIELLPRFNVEKGPLKHMPGEVMEMEVLPFRLSTDELLTVEAMGSGVAVVLFLVCLDSASILFLNLTDYIEKVLNPEMPKWRDQGSIGISVPTLNVVARDSPLLRILRFYGIRPKLMGMFNKVHFQWAELAREVRSKDWPVMALHFGDALLRLDVWDAPAWSLLAEYRISLARLVGQLAEAPDRIDRQAVVDFWFRMDAIGRTFEDVTREWGLPTQLGLTCSYPD
jgi:hypothetical protein